MAFACHNLSKLFPGRDKATAALENASLRVADNEFVSIVGPSGCGKTTLLKLIAGLIEPTGGRIEFTGPAANGKPRTALVFQEHGLFPWMSVLDNVAFGLEMQNVPRAERREKSLKFIEQVGLGAFARKFPHELSVGMRQRVGIVRAFLADPDILLLDEPFGSLDAQTKVVLQEELLRIWRDHRKSVLHVTHDIEEAIWLADRVIVLSGRPGTVREDIAVPLARPRERAALALPELLEIKASIWRILEEEVRKSLWISK